MYRVGLIGLGNIAARYSRPDDLHPYSHVGGCRQGRKCRVVAAVDLSAEAREAFVEDWGPVNMYEDADEMLAKEGLDVAAVCVKGPLHEMMSLKAIEAGVKVVFQEKPAGCSLREIDTVHEGASAAGVMVVISHTRHWGPHVMHMADLVRNQGLIGEVHNVVGYCGGTLLSFASHQTDMICQFAGYDPISVMAYTEPGSEEVSDGYEPELAIRGALYEFASGVIGYHVGAAGPRGAFYVDVTGTEGSAHVPFYGIPEARDTDGQPIELDLPKPASPFKIAYNQIGDYLDGGPAPDCGPAMYRPVNELSFGVMDSSQTGQMVKLPVKNRERKVWAVG